MPVDIAECPSCSSLNTNRAGLGRGRRCVPCKHTWVGPVLPEKVVVVPGVVAKAPRVRKETAAR